MIAMWRWCGQGRPPFAVATAEGPESVWDHPRPPRVAADDRCAVVRAMDVAVANARRALRVLETANPPTF